jgi:CheY-like chemotaxis protein
MATLLLADDSVTIQRVIELTFADEGIRVISVSDGQSAIAHLNAETPDIVLADVGMPDVDGYQVAAHVKHTPALAHVPVLLLTGAFEPIDEPRARATGCEGVLVKPFEPRHLIRTVRSLLFGQRPADLWPADMPRVEIRTERPMPAPPAPAPVPEPITQSVAYEADSDPDLAIALARLEFVAAPDPDLPPDIHVLAAAPDGDDTPSVEWDLSAAPTPTVAPISVPAPVFAMSSPVPAPERETPLSPAEPMSLAAVFSALLAAERKGTEPRSEAMAGAALSEAHVEEVVQRVVSRMTDELVRKIVLETAERLIREEIDRIKS